MQWRILESLVIGILRCSNLFNEFAVKASAYSSRPQLHPSKTEVELFGTLNKEGKLLEQERIPLSHVRNKLESTLS